MARVSTGVKEQQGGLRGGGGQWHSVADPHAALSRIQPLEDPYISDPCATTKFVCESSEGSFPSEEDCLSQFVHRGNSPPI